MDRILEAWDGICWLKVMYLIPKMKGIKSSALQAVESTNTSKISPINYMLVSGLVKVGGE